MKNLKEAMLWISTYRKTVPPDVVEALDCIDAMLSDYMSLCGQLKTAQQLEERLASVKEGIDCHMVRLVDNNLSHQVFTQEDKDNAVKVQWGLAGLTRAHMDDCPCELCLARYHAVLDDPDAIDYLYDTP